MSLDLVMSGLINLNNHINTTLKQLHNNYFRFYVAYGLI